MHIGKTAGTQIEHISNKLISYGVDIKKAGHDLKLKSIKGELPYFFSIRDPAQRFKSGFYSRKRKGQPRLYVEWSKFEAIAFNEFEHANDLAEALLQNDKKGLNARAAIKAIRHTGMQQVDWFEGVAFLDQRPPMHIIRQEYFNNDMQELINSIGVDLKVESLITTDPISAHKNNYQGAPDLSELAIHNLSQWYMQGYYFYKQCEEWLKKKEIANQVTNQT